MSTRYVVKSSVSAPTHGPSPRAQDTSTKAVVKRPGSARPDPLELLARVASERRRPLLWAHRHRLRHEDLEDCYSQTTFELLRHARAGGSWGSAGHLVNHLDQRFVSRVQDRLRAVHGRSAMQAAIEDGLAGELLALPDIRCSLEELVMLRLELRLLSRLARELTHDQRLVLASQLAQMNCGEFCETYGWSSEKYRKVAQRARARLRELRDRQLHDGTPLARAAAADHKLRARP